MTSEEEELHSDVHWCRSRSSELLQSRFWLEKVKRETEEEEDFQHPHAAAERRREEEWMVTERGMLDRKADGLTVLSSSVAVTEQLPPAGRTATPGVPRGSSRCLQRRAAGRELWVL